MSDPIKEKTVVLIKPDAVKRGIIGEVISRFEKTGLKIVALKMVWIDKDFAARHYPSDREEFITGMGKKTLATYEKYGRDPGEELGTKDPHEIGKMVNQWNMDFITSGPLIAVLLQGLHAIDNVRMIAGNTIPTTAQPGTIRGDFSLDSPILANAKKRAVRNIMHASGNAEEAKFEEELWFHKNEIHDYKRADEEVMF